MKLLSIAIPCYNSEAYMRNCIESLLPGGDEVEILIVDDGSTKDNTAQIADEYEARYPGICRAIHQENGGHGEAVNAGLRAATGIYFKVVDSDDWVNAEAYKEVLETLRSFVMGNQTLDMLITNFVYEKQGAKHKRVMQYRTALPKRQLCTWKDVKVFMPVSYTHLDVYKRQEQGGDIQLTEEGLAKAKSIYARHLLLTAFLQEVTGVSEEMAEENACRMEHILDQEVVDGISTYMSKSK